MNNFMPHAMCLLGNTTLIFIHVFSDAVIFLSYMVISSLLFAARRSGHLFTYLIGLLRRGEPDLVLKAGLAQWAFASFATFIGACGMTHLMDIVVLWFPLYWIQGVIKFVTATASASTAYLLVRIAMQYVKAKRNARMAVN